MDWQAAGFRLTDEQKAAAEAPLEGLTCVVAGAGCGKTYLVTARFLYLVVEKGVEPEKILCLTFSEHGAAEMRRRIEKTLIHNGLITPKLCVFTFHSFCDAMLREHEAEAGITGDFVVLDEGECELLMEQARRKLMENPPPFEALNVDFMWRALIEATNIIEDARLCGMSREDLAAVEALFGEGPRARWRRDILKMALNLWEYYEEAKQAQNALDFTDLLERMLRLLKSPAGDRIRRRFRFIIVDEYQDTDRLQQKILESLCGEALANLYVVGDVRQSIYAWRGAYPEGLISLARRGRNLPLTRNFRSRNEILQLANALINADKKMPKSSLHNPAEPQALVEPVFVLLFERVEEEAQWVADRIRQLLDAGHPPDEIAVLARSRTHLVRLEQALEERGVAYVALVRNIYEAPEVLDVGHVLVLGGEGEDKEARVWLAMRRSGKLEVRDDGGLPEPDEEVISVAKEAAGMETFSAVEFVAERLGHLGRESKRANIDRLLERAARWVSTFPGSPPWQFGRYILAMRRIGAHEPVTNPYRPYGAVKILTIHAAKGLEFDTVFLFDTRIHPFSKKRNFILDPEGVGIAVKRLPGEGDKDSREYEDALLRQKARERHEAEERRLLHVGVTRARRHLFITGRKGRGGRGFPAMMKKALVECGFMRQE